MLFVDILNQVAKYKVEHALPTQQLIVNQAELEHQMLNDIEDNGSEAVEDNLSTDENKNEVNHDVNHDVNDISNSDDIDGKQNGVDLIKEADKTKDNKAAEIQANKEAKHKRINLDKERQQKRKALVKNKFKRAKRKFGFSIWNQP